MEKISVAIVEDEFLIGHDISENLKAVGYAVSGIYDCGIEAIEGLKTTQPDIILMDINIKGSLDGIETAEIIRTNWDLPIIYITAYTDTATIKRAKKTLPHAFIVKPFNFNNLSTTIEFAVYNYANKITPELETSAARPIIKDNEHLSEKTIFIKEKGHLVKVKTSDIYFLSAKGSYTEIITAQKKFTISRNLQTILSKLNSDVFIRTHRSYAVNINKIEAIYDSELLIGRQKIPISKLARTDLLTRVQAI